MIEEPAGGVQIDDNPHQDAYFSVDVETDGPIPGIYSLLAFAIVEAGHHDGRRYVSPDRPEARYWEIKPQTDRFEDEALRVNRLDRDRLLIDADEPTVAMPEACEWVEERARGRRPIMVASPAGFDWMFMHWYFIRYAGESPFGHSSCFDIKTAISVKFDRPVAMSGHGNIPGWLESDVPHSHNALDDAIEQAQLFTNLLEWRGISSSAAF